LVDLKTDELLEVVIQEILQDKIYLDSDANLHVADGEYGQSGPPELDFSKL
jgi:DNA-directed RNA polymerase subunit omega